MESFKPNRPTFYVALWLILDTRTNGPSKILVSKNEVLLNLYLIYSFSTPLSLNMLNITKFFFIAKFTCDLRILPLPENLFFMNLFNQNDSYKKDYYTTFFMLIYVVLFCGREGFEPKELIPYRRLYRFGQRYDIFRISVNISVPFRVYRYFLYL